MAETQGFCPHCGQPRMVGAQFCPSCGGDLEGSPRAAPPTQPATNTPALLAGISWLLCAAVTGYLAYQQWSLYELIKGTVLDQGNLSDTASQNAILNAATAVITLYFGARLLAKPTHGLFMWSIIWAVIDVAWGLYQIGQGVRSDAFVLAVIAAGAAGVLSLVAQASAPAKGNRAATPARSEQHVAPPAQPEPAVSFAPRVEPVAVLAPKIAPAASLERERTSPVLVFLVILTGLIALAAVGYALAIGPGQGLIAGLSPTPSPTATPTAQPTPPPVVVPTYPTGGVVTFGSSYDPNTLLIGSPLSSFKASSKAIAWSASMTGPVNSSAVLWTVASRTASGVETQRLNETINVSDPQSDTFANKVDLASLLDRVPGTYVMRYLVGSTVLAEGTFTLAK